MKGFLPSRYWLFAGCIVALVASALVLSLHPSTGTTKRDVLEYVLRASDALMAHAAGRPVTRKRWVDGVGTARKPGAVFFQKTLEKGAPDWIETVEQRHSTGPKQYPLLTEAGTLAWMAQMGAHGLVKVAVLGKLKTIAQMVAISCLLFEENLLGLPVFRIGEWLLAIAAALTLWSGWDYLHAAWPAMRRDDARRRQDRTKQG